MNSPYATKAPSLQQTLDIFKGKWASRLPSDKGGEAGETPLFDDPRVDWAVENLAKLGVELKSSNVLEIGPLEGGHTYRLIRSGAKSVTAVEAHPEAFLKCLVAKELLSMERVNFLYGDAAAFLVSIGHSYDIGFASGILYHMVNPVEFLELLCRRSRAVFIWTVYWDAAFSVSSPGAAGEGAGAVQSSHAGFRHTLHRHDYGSGFDYSQFWGGPSSHSNWMEKDEIMGALSHFGFSRQILDLEANPNGPALRLVATRP
ncbi:MAG TPA: class I SAM-dependent methyltransferase [Opitutaceae bacterium]|nr:class I SAM-dependent methyltransferase [Opitutaceae bacterium]